MRNAKPILFATVMALLLAATIALGQYPRRLVPQPAPADRRPVPEFVLTGNSGELIRHSDLRGRRYGLLLFSADCEYCADALQKLDRYFATSAQHREFYPATASPPDRLAEFRARLQLKLPLYRITDETMRRFEASGYPLLALIDEEGRIVYRQHGSRDEAFFALVLDRFASGASLSAEALREAHEQRGRRAAATEP